MMSNSGHHPCFCFINAVVRSGGRFAFAGSLALSLLFHLAAYSAFVLLKANTEQTPKKAAVIEIDLSAITTPGSPGAIPAARRIAGLNHDARKGGASVRSGIPSIEQTVPKKQEQPVRIPGPAKDTVMTANEPRAGISSPGTVLTAVAENGKSTGSVSGTGKEGGGDRSDNGNEGSVRRTGAGKGTTAALAEYSRTIRSLIERHKEYPLAARKLGIHGSVVVSFTLNYRGELQDVSLAKSSGNSMLDNAGMRAVRTVDSFPPPPRHAMHGEVVCFRIPITFALAAG